MNDMSRYTGAKDDEVFVGNTQTKNGIPHHLRGLKTIRLGDQALDIDGNELDPSDMRPLFVAQNEAAEYDRIMMRRTFPMQFR